ncbi:insulinase family protein [Candidatus Pacearchaeota archaeon]|nr:insulinase family protein [Candidatus Pacearchaeota archaeon]
MRFVRRELKNGMTVVAEHRDLPVVSFSIANKFGAGYEKDQIKGIAHFIEHLVFTGTKTRSHEDISREIEKRGGVVNAFTANEVTCFWFKLPSEHLYRGMEISHDILTHPTFEKKKFEKEKKVILEEIKMYHDDPGRNVHDKIVENMFEKPFGTGIIGNAKTVSALKRDFVLKYFKKNYSPENYIVSLVGKFDMDKLCLWLEQKFIRRGKRESILPIKIRNSESVESREGIDQAHLIFGVHAPLMNSKDYVSLEILDAYLANGMSSKLFLKIREEKGLAYSVNSSLNSERSYSYYTIYAGTTKKAVPEVKKLIIEGFREVSSMTEKDLQEAKERLIGLQQISREESLRVMQELLFYELASKAENYYERQKFVQAVRLGDVKRLAKEMVLKYSTAAIVPK